MDASKKTRLGMMLVMLAAFLYCVLVPLLLRNSIPDSFSALVQAVFETFAPTLSVMLGCTYARHAAGAKSMPAEIQSHWQAEDALALALVTIYCLVFVIVMSQFLLEVQDTRASDVITLFGKFRTMGAFLLTGVVAFYFSPKRATRSARSH